MHSEAVPVVAKTENSQPVSRRRRGRIPALIPAGGTSQVTSEAHSGRLGEGHPPGTNENLTPAFGTRYPAAEYRSPGPVEKWIECVTRLAELKMSNDRSSDTRSVALSRSLTPSDARQSECADCQLGRRFPGF